MSAAVRWVARLTLLTTALIVIFAATTAPWSAVLLAVVILTAAGVHRRPSSLPGSDTPQTP